MLCYMCSEKYSLEETMENVLPVLYQDIVKCYILGEEFEGCIDSEFLQLTSFYNQ